MRRSLGVCVPDELPDVPLADLGAIVGASPGARVHVLVETLLAEHVVALENVLFVPLAADLALKLLLEGIALQLEVAQV